MVTHKPHRHINACLLNPQPVLTVKSTGAHGRLPPRIQMHMHLQVRGPKMLTNKVKRSFPFARGRFPDRALPKATSCLHTLYSILRRCMNIKTWLDRNLPVLVRASRAMMMTTRNATSPRVVKELIRVALASEYLSC